MSSETDESDGSLTPAVGTAIEISIRLGAITLLVLGCLMIIAPFLGIMVWALIIAIAADGPYNKLCQAFGGRRKLAAFVAVTGMLLILIVPAVKLSETLISGAQYLAEDVRDGNLNVPPPDARVAEWPVVGPRLYETWTRASGNLAEALTQFAPQLRAVSGWLLQAAGSAGAGILQFFASILIAGIILSRNEARKAAIEGFAIRMAGRERGPELSTLANATVRSVVQGILGVALIQAILAGGGLMVAGIPGAGLWALLALVAAVVQIPIILALAGPMIYAFSFLGGAAAIAFAVWCIAVSTLDNFLKPLLFGRGVEVPTLVIFMGAIGGMLSMGIIGLFLGSVVLALGYQLFLAWLTPEAGDIE